MTTLVVSWDCNIDELGWRVGVAESNDGDIDVGSFFDGLGIGSGVRDDDEAGLFEGSGDVVGEVTWGEATSDRLCAGVGSEFEYSTLAVRTGGNDADIGWVVDGSDNAGSEDDFLPRRSLFSALFAIWEVRRSDAVALRHRKSDMLLKNVLNLLPGFADVDHVDSIRTSLPQIWFHVNLQVL